MFKSVYSALFLLIACLGLTSCFEDSFPKGQIFSDEVNASFESILAAFESKDPEKIKQVSVKELADNEEFLTAFEQFFSIMPDNISQLEIVYAEHRISDTSGEAYPLYSATYEFPYGEEFVLLNLVTQAQGKVCCLLRHIQYKSYHEQLSTYHNFKSIDPDLKRILFLCLMSFTLFFIILTLIHIVFHKTLKKKWLWFILALFGTYGATLNWTTGDIAPNFFKMTDKGISFSFIKFSLFGGSFTRAGIFHPWMFDWGFPLVAVFYWITEVNKKRRTGKSSNSLEA